MYENGLVNVFVYCQMYDLVAASWREQQTNYFFDELIKNNLFVIG